MQTNCPHKIRLNLVRGYNEVYVLCELCGCKTANVAYHGQDLILLNHFAHLHGPIHSISQLHLDAQQKIIDASISDQGKVFNKLIKEQDHSNARKTSH